MRPPMDEYSNEGSVPTVEYLTEEHSTLLAGWKTLHETSLSDKQIPYRGYIEMPKVTRVTVVSNDGVVFEKYNLFENGVTLALQDDDRTLKIFPKELINDN